MSNFFGNFPVTSFENKILTDLSIRIKIRDSWLNNPELYYTYEYKDTDKPEDIAHKYYSDQRLHWIILLTNNIFDVNFDFPMNPNVFSSYISDKYKNKGGVKILTISSAGGGYTNGVYSNIQLEATQGSDIRVDLTVSSNVVSNISVLRGGTGYTTNTVFSISNTDPSWTGSGFVGSVASHNFMNSFEYANSNIDPIFGYQLQTQVISPDNTTSRYTVVDSNYYYSFAPQEVSVTTFDAEVVKHKISRREPITIYQKELETNESKRLIRILKKEYITNAVKEVLRLM